MSKRDYYEVLGIAKTATADELKKAYRVLASKNHPDKGGDTSKFQEIQEAYATLSDPAKREAYNQHGHASTDPNFGHGPQQWTHNVNINDVFGNIFGSQGNPFAEMFNQQNRQPRYLIHLSLEDAFAGKQLTFSGGHTLAIPAGVRQGTRFMVDSKIYQIDILQHNKFKRSDDDLLVETEITAFEAILGVEAVLSHLNDVKLQFKIPPGIQNGQIVRLAGKGMPNPEIDKRGDLLVRISITIPKDLVEGQIFLIKTLPHRDTFNI